MDCETSVTSPSIAPQSQLSMHDLRQVIVAVTVGGWRSDDFITAGSE